jgi:UDP-2-acetamido-2,6-beta-L-arabino-hexul-4-ose reductase
MKILVTGAKGFVGKNLCATLKNIRDGKDRTHPGLKIEDVYEYDIDSSVDQLSLWCQKANFVFNLAGVNRPKDASEFMEGNFGFASTLLDMLKKYENRCPVMYRVPSRQHFPDVSAPQSTGKAKRQVKSCSSNTARR